MALLGECRCCRKPIDRSRLACPPHWAMLPKPLKDAIFETYKRHDMRAYAANIGEADKIWQAAGIWKPGVPMSTRSIRDGTFGVRSAVTMEACSGDAKFNALCAFLGEPPREGIDDLYFPDGIRASEIERRLSDAIAELEKR